MKHTHNFLTDNNNKASGNMETSSHLALLFVGVALVLTFLSLAIATRIWRVVVPARVKASVDAYRSSTFIAQAHNASASPRLHARTMAVLGSGGHTTEMLKLMKRLDRNVYSPVAFVVAETDKTSKEKTELDWRPRADVDKFVVIPRSREVRMCSCLDHACSTAL